MPGSGHLLWAAMLVATGLAIVGLDPGSAMERSAEITKPYAGYIWGMIAIMILIGLLNAIPGVGWMLAFVLGMLYCAAPALRYDELKGLHTGRHRPTGHHEQDDSLEENELVD
jgi:hypothetical protein